MQNPRILACVVAALGSLTAAGCGSSNDCDSDNLSNCACNGSNDTDDNNNCVGVGSNTCAAGVLRIENQSGFTLKAVQVSTVGGTDFGVNLISAPLASGASITVTATGRHDVLLIDAAGEQCTLHGVDLCSNNATLIVGSSMCSTFTKQDP